LGSGLLPSEKDINEDKKDQPNLNEKVIPFGSINKTIALIEKKVRDTYIHNEKTIVTHVDGSEEIQEVNEKHTSDPRIIALFQEYIGRTRHKIFVYDDNVKTYIYQLSGKDDNGKYFRTTTIIEERDARNLFKLGNIAMVKKNLSGKNSINGLKSRLRKEKEKNE
jgi:hypothetical protein